MTPNLYGLTLAVAVLGGYIAARKLAPRFGVEPNQIDDALPWIVFFGFLGARAYYVIFSWSFFGEHLIEIFKIWHGGLSIYGGLLGGVLGAFIYSRRAGRISFLNFADLLAIVTPLAQSLGRWGNFFNHEAFGRPTNLPWAIYIPPEFRPLPYLEEPYFHPAFLYESLWDLGVFLLLLYYLRERHKPGILVGSYLILYSLGRFFIEGLRVDSLLINSFRVDQLTALLMMIIGGVILILNYGTSVRENN